MNPSSKLQVIVPAAGRGERMGMKAPKAFLPVAGEPMILRTVKMLAGLGEISVLVVLIPPGDRDQAEQILSVFQEGPEIRLVEGGAERTDSVRRGLQAVDEDAGWIAVHDAARPFLSADDFRRVFAEARKSGAAIPGVPLKPTIKRVGKNGLTVHETLPRDVLWEAQTPQIFRRDILLKAYAGAEGSASDDAKLVEDTGVPVTIVPGSYRNIKITTPEDLSLAELFLREEDGYV
ncbi:MAG: 2-C-methyl-D-erythritol 4-phosphate cytidylyltransferase [Candidatus Omnitrophota bacterium]